VERVEMVDTVAMVEGVEHEGSLPLARPLPAHAKVATRSTLSTRKQIIATIPNLTLLCCAPPDGAGRSRPYRLSDFFHNLIDRHPQRLYHSEYLCLL
jgi:hypothetical protein